MYLERLSYAVEYCISNRNQTHLWNRYFGHYRWNKFLWRPRNPINNKSILVRLIVWCHQAATHCLNQCWPNFISSCVATKPQWVNKLFTANKYKRYGILQFHSYHTQRSSAKYVGSYSTRVALDDGLAKIIATVDRDIEYNLCEIYNVLEM